MLKKQYTEYCYKPLLDSPTFNFFSHYPSLCMCVHLYAHMNFPFAKMLSSSLKIEHFTPKCLIINLPRKSPNSNSISISFKTLTINLIQHTDHTQIFSECPVNIFYSLCWCFLSRIESGLTRCIYLLYWVG